ncbi:MAG: phage portal protein [Subdoligranulum sp.]
MRQKRRIPELDLRGGKTVGLLDRLRNAFGQRSISTVQLIQENGTRYMAWHGGLYDADIVRACIRPKAKAVGKLVAKHIRETVDANGERSIAVNPAPGIRRLLEEPNPYMTGQVMQEKLATQLCLNNNAFALIVRDDMGLPTGIYPVLPQTAEALYSNDGTLALRMQLPNNKVFTFAYSDIIHLRQDFNEDDIFGTPIGNVLTPLLDVVSTTDQGIVNAIKNSSVIRWLLKFSNPLRPDDLKKQAEDFSNNYLSTTKGTGVAAVDSKADATQIEPKDYVPNAAQMDLTKQRIYALFNTNAKIVDSSRSEEEWNAYFDAEVEPVLRQLGGEYTRKLFTLRERGFGNKIVFEASSWDGASLSTKLNLMQMVDRGSLTPNEWRYAFNLAPVPGGDEPIRRLDTAPVTGGGVTE